ADVPNGKKFSSSISIRNLLEQTGRSQDVHQTNTDFQAPMQVLQLFVYYLLLGTLVEAGAFEQDP
ncbi:unnamed protein product, partial [marine sediment metagenome]